MVATLIDLVNRYGKSVSQMTRDVSFVVITIQSFPHSQLITEIVTRVTRQVPLVEQEPLHFKKISIHI